MLRKLLKSFDANPFKLDNRNSVCPMWQFSIEVYKELDKRSYPAIFKLLESKDKNKVEEARNSLHKFTSLFYLETARPLEEVPLDALEESVVSNNDIASLQVGGFNRLDMEDVLGCSNQQLRQ